MEEISLNEILKIILKRKILVIIIVAFFALLGWVYTSFGITPMYEASTSVILVNNKFENEADVVVYSTMNERYSVLARSRTVADKVIENLKLDMSLAELNSCISVEPMGAYGFWIKVKTTDINNVAAISDEVAKVLIKEVETIYNDKNIQILDAAVPNTNPVNIDLFGNVIRFVFIGIIVAVIIVFIEFFVKRNKKEVKNENKE